MSAPSLTPGTDYLQSPLLSGLGFSHAFFCRSGGASTGPYASLSFSVAAGDDPAHVEENLRRAAGVLGVAADRVLYLSQVHGTEVVTADAAATREQTLEQRGDGILSLSPVVACGVRSADCVPLLLAHVESGAVCAAHAGWRGVAGGMAAAAVDALRREVGPGRVVAAIGPHIGAEAFEVGDDVADALEAACPRANAVNRERWPKPHVSLLQILVEQLREVGLDAGDVEFVAGCTMTDATRFFSYRRDGKLSGRHLSAIVPRRIV